MELGHPCKDFQRQGVRLPRNESQSPSSWSLEEELTAEDNDGFYTNEFYFGNHIALRNNELVVSARGYDTNATHGKYVGKVYIYSMYSYDSMDGSETYRGWSLDPQSDGSTGLTAPDGAYDHHEFGYGLAFDGEVIAVGSLDHANPNANDTRYDIFRGSVYVFRRNPPSSGNSDCALEQQITVVDRGANNHFFGRSIFLQGSKLAVSSIGMSDPPNVDTGAANYVGSVYVFDGPSDKKSRPLKVIYQSSLASAPSSSSSSRTRLHTFVEFGVSRIERSRQRLSNSAVQKSFCVGACTRDL